MGEKASNGVLGENGSLKLSKFEGSDPVVYANILRSRNKFADAVVLYESVIEKGGSNFEALIGKGICLQMQNLSRQAFESFTEVIRLDPQNAYALTHCGILYKDEGHLLEAAEADAKTHKFRDRVQKKGGLWRDIYGIDEKKVAGMVREDKVDILLELTGHTANNKLGMMACRPAPIQATWIGYPYTTGLPTIDYRITDALTDPLDSKQKHVEELVRLPECFLCYTPSPEAGPVFPTPALSNGFITFGSFNNLAKITPKVLQVWARILCAVPNSRLVIKCKPFCGDSVRQRFLSMLEHLGLEPLRVDLLPLILLNHDHMQAYSLMDISLDTFPYAGTTTTCESLYMGVPCVTMAGSVHAHNVGVSLLKNVGLERLVAKTEDEYFKLALSLASDIPAFSELRMSLRELMAKSPACNGLKFTKNLESAYRSMWLRYCRGDVPALKNLESLILQQPKSDKISILFSDAAKDTSKEENQQPALKMNGARLVSSSTPNLSSVREACDLQM